jgi:two-component system, sensor histidine kinase and response regulator
MSPDAPKSAPPRSGDLVDGTDENPADAGDDAGALHVWRPGVLVVDDVKANLIAMEALLRDLDCDVVSSSSGNDALRHLLKRDFAAVLLDVQMPEMDGFEVARLARGSPRSVHTPIIFVTAILPTEENLFRGYESGAVDVLFKPVNPHVLRSKMKVFLDLHRTRRGLADEIAAHKRTLEGLEAFNSSVSHDLRSPLRHMTAFSSILLEDHGARLDDDGRALVGKIIKAASRMDRIIDDLLRLSRVTSVRPTARSMDLAALAESVIAELRAADPSRSVETVVAPRLLARADEPLLRIALENLLRNAWKFTSRTPAARIEVGARPGAAGKPTIYFVKDNGVGFEQEQAHLLFRAFQRLHSKDAFEGTGIGLAIVQRVIHQHGGRIWAEAEPDAGATFFFTLGA